MIRLSSVTTSALNAPSLTPIMTISTSTLQPLPLIISMTTIMATRMTVSITTVAHLLLTDDGPFHLATTLSSSVLLSYRYTLRLQMGARNALTMKALTSQEKMISLVSSLKTTLTRLRKMPGLRSGEQSGESYLQFPTATQPRIAAPITARHPHRTP
jgi:hypothetical protein